MTYVTKMAKSLPAFRVVGDDSSDKKTKGIEDKSSEFSAPLLGKKMKLSCG